MFKQVASTVRQKVKKFGSIRKMAFKFVKTLVLKSGMSTTLWNQLASYALAFCSMTEFGASMVEPTLFYLKKSKGEYRVSMGESSDAPMTWKVRKLTFRKSVGRPAVKDSADENYMPSQSIKANRVICEAEGTLRLSKCSTCCCKDGMVRMEIKNELTYKVKGELGTRCGGWFTNVDMILRLIGAVCRGIQFIVFTEQACFVPGRNPLTEAMIGYNSKAKAQIKEACKSDGCRALPQRAIGCTIRLSDAQKLRRKSQLIKVASTGKCFDSYLDSDFNSYQQNKGGKVHIVNCDANNDNQIWTYDAVTKRVRGGHGKCLDQGGDEGAIRMWQCSPSNKYQEFEYNSHTKLLKGANNNDKCVDGGKNNGGNVHMVGCNPSNTNQQLVSGIF